MRVARCCALPRNNGAYTCLDRRFGLAATLACVGHNVAVAMHDPRGFHHVVTKYETQKPFPAASLFFTEHFHPSNHRRENRPVSTASAPQCGAEGTASDFSSITSLQRSKLNALARNLYLLAIVDTRHSQEQVHTLLVLSNLNRRPGHLRLIEPKRNEHGQLMQVRKPLIW